MAKSTSEVRVIRPDDRSIETQQTSGMTREAAITTAGMWGGFVRTAPGMSSGWHHHGDHETAIYVLKGRARLEFGTGGSASVDAREGDFLYVPPGAVHRESNPTEEEGNIIVIRAGTGLPVVNVDGPAD